jgi:hypothetical protein
LPIENLRPEERDETQSPVVVVVVVFPRRRILGKSRAGQDRVNYGVLWRAEAKKKIEGQIKHEALSPFFLGESEGMFDALVNFPVGQCCARCQNDSGTRIIPH